MASYLIKRNDEEQSISVYKCEKKGFDFKPNFKYEDINIKKITVYNPEMINIILVKKIEKAFRKITAIVIDVIQNDDDSTAEDGILALSEIARLRNIILNKYQKHLEKEKEEEYLKKLRILENELRAKITYEKHMNEMYNYIFQNEIAPKVVSAEDERRNGR